MSVAYEQPKNSTDYRFSQSEIKLLNLLPQDGTKINTLELTKKFYSDRRVLPEYARIAIGGLIRALVDKTYDFKRGFRVMRSERQGPKPILVWMEVLPSRAKAKSVQAKSVQAKSVQAKSVQAKSVQAKSVQAKSVQAKSVQAKPEEAKPEEAKPEEAKPEEAKPEEAKLKAKPLDRGKPKILDKPKARQEARRMARRAGPNGAARA
jgi:hypothetical protein